MINEKIKKANEKFDQDKEAFKLQKVLIEKIEYMRQEQKKIIKEKKEQEKQERME